MPFQLLLEVCDSLHKRGGEISEYEVVALFVEAKERRGGNKNSSVRYRRGEGSLGLKENEDETYREGEIFDSIFDLLEL